MAVTCMATSMDMDGSYGEPCGSATDRLTITSLYQGVW